MESEFKNIIKERVELENKLYKSLREIGVNFVSGVPCGVQKYIILNFSNDPEIVHIPANKESEAIGIAAGAFLAGKMPTVYMQNSGLMNSINDITSLLIPYKIPLIFLVSWRGTAGEDAPQHFINGKCTKGVLEKIGVSVKILDKKNTKEITLFAREWVGRKKIPMVILIKRKI